MFVRAFAFFLATKKCCYFVRKGYKHLKKSFFMTFSAKKKLFTPPLLPLNDYENYFFGTRDKVFDLANKMMVSILKSDKN